MRTMYNSSRGWYTKRTLSCSTMVCWVPESANLGKDASKASIRERAISRNWRERTALPPRVHIDAARTTYVVTWQSVSVHEEPPDRSTNHGSENRDRISKAVTRANRLQSRRNSTAAELAFGEDRMRRSQMVSRGAACCSLWPPVVRARRYPLAYCNTFPPSPLLLLVSCPVSLSAGRIREKGLLTTVF